MTEENFVRTVRTVFEKIAKGSKRAVFGRFWTTSVPVVKSQSYEFDAIAYIGP